MLLVSSPSFLARLNSLTFLGSVLFMRLTPLIMIAIWLFSKNPPTVSLEVSAMRLIEELIRIGKDRMFTSG